MSSRKSTTILIALVSIAVMWLSVSCQKKSLRTEEMAAQKPAVTEAEKPSPKTEKAPPAKPGEKTLTEESLFRQEAGEFENRDIHFDFDKYDLKPLAREILAEKAYFLKKYPTAKILIEGHCDERGTNEYNLALGERRANSAKQYLINLGISADRISIVSYGEERPLDPRQTEEAWAKNRRDHFVIVSH